MFTQPPRPIPRWRKIVALVLEGLYVAFYAGVLLTILQVITDVVHRGVARLF